MALPSSVMKDGHGKPDSQVEDMAETQEESAESM